MTEYGTKRFKHFGGSVATMTTVTRTYRGWLVVHAISNYNAGSSVTSVLVNEDECATMGALTHEDFLLRPDQEEWKS